MWKGGQKAFTMVARWTRTYSFVELYRTRKFNRQFTNYVPLIERMAGFCDKIAVIDHNASFTYEKILRSSAVLGKDIKEVLRKVGKFSRPVVHDGVACGPRIAILCPNDVSFAVMVCAVWQSGGIVVPLCKTHPMGELDYVVSDSQVSLIISTQEFSAISQELARLLNIGLIVVPNDGSISIPDGRPLFGVEKETKNLGMLYDQDNGAMIVYTSGTTGRPKGVLLTHKAISSQILALVEAWEWSTNDSILHVLPLHHIHGIVNVSLCSLWSGATCHMLPKFDAKEVWKYILNDYPNINIFMAVPTIYSKLLQAYNEQNYNELEKQEVREKCKKFRLMVSGSAAMAESMLSEWQSATGIRLLERYGMTEIGMALSNPLHGDRLLGRVGSPLPNVRVKIVKRTEDGQESVLAQGDQHRTVFYENDGNTGELYVKGPSLFKMYWNRPEATIEAFSGDGWFKTGDTVEYQNNSYKIMGRTSVDIIKSGGYKISALDVEDHLLTHPDIVECAVVGTPDPEWGQRIAALVVCAKGKELSLKNLKNWAESRMVPYHIPSLLKCVESIPRNAMGKVNKKLLVAEFFNGEKLSQT